MILYHGTAAHNEKAILEGGPRASYHHDMKKKPLFCTSVSFKEAAFFALRKTPMSDLSKTGVVIEFSADLGDGDFVAIESKGLLRDEREIAVLRPDKLKPRAIWRFEDGKWNRCVI